jgi:hypothetical protein
LQRRSSRLLSELAGGYGTEVRSKLGQLRSAGLLGGESSGKQFQGRERRGR